MAAATTPWGIGARTAVVPSSPLRGVSVGRILQFGRRSSGLGCRCCVSGVGVRGRGEKVGEEKGGGVVWDWSRWRRHFDEIEQDESFVSVLKFQLEEAVEKEDFLEAARLKSAIAEAALKDSVTEIMSELKKAIEEERYQDASKLSRHSGSNLIGWWVGYSSLDSGDRFGRLVRITPGVGRFIGRGYTPRQLVTSSPGTPLFEIYVVKDADDAYTMQVVYLQRTKGDSTSSSNMLLKPTRPDMLESDKEREKEKEEETSLPSTASAEATTLGIQDNVEDKTEKQEKIINVEGASEEGIKSVINFLKDKIPVLNLKFMNMEVTEEVVGENEAPAQMSQEEAVDDDDDDEDDDSEEDIGDTSEDESDTLDEPQPDSISLGDGDPTDDEKDLGLKFFLGGVVHNTDDVPTTKDEFHRLPADIKDMAKDSFLLHIPGLHGSRENNVFDMKVASVIEKHVAELMTPDVAKAFMGTEKMSSKVFRKAGEMLKLASSHMKKRKRLSEYTTFNRLNTSKDNLDPFDGLYIGAFGLLGTEVVQLRRKFGHWNGSSDFENPSDVEFFEYVEAIKLTGDLNVPAGEVTFRAKIGKGLRKSNRGLYPDELGVVASYKGQGRVAEYGSLNAKWVEGPKWVEGELLQLNGKGIGPYSRGADLGFLYTIPGQSFLVLFNRLNLPE